MILILSDSLDLAADHVTSVLGRRGRSYFRVNADQLASYHFEMCVNAGQNRMQVTAGPRTCEVSRVRAIWYRRMPVVALPAEYGERGRQFVSGEIQNLVDSMLLSTRGLWVNPFRSTWEAERKLFQLSLAQELGMPFPETLVTSDVAVASTFAAKHSQGIIAKPIYHGFWRDDGVEKAVYTHTVSDAMLDMPLAAPTLFQAQVRRGIDVRLTLIGNEAFAAALRFPGSDTQPDWRDPNANVSYDRIELPKTLLEKCRALMKRLDLVYGAIDLIQSDTGDWYFLEVNPAGEWLWIESALGYPITDRIIHVLESA